MSFRDDIKAFTLTLEGQTREVFFGCTEEVQRSVVEGSEITTAPGQPVDTGNLKASWIGGFTQTDGLAWELTTNTVYAPNIEEGVGQYWVRTPPSRKKPKKDEVVEYVLTDIPLTLRSEVGGFHSVKLTIAGWPRIVEAVVARVKAVRNA